MRKPRRIGFLVVAIAASLMAIGCASFKQNRLPQIDAFPPPPAKSGKPTATYSFTYTYKILTEGEAPERTRALLSREFADVLIASGQFASLAESSSAGDVHIEVHLRNYGNPAALIPAFITGFSLFTIPSWATDRWSVTARVLKGAAEYRSYTFDDSDVLVQWLPMIVVMPFKFPGQVIPEVRRNMYKNLVKAMRDSGALSVP